MAEKLRELVKDPSLRVRLALIEAVQRSMNPALFGILDEMSVRDQEGRIRRAARDSIRKIREILGKGTQKEVLDELEKIRAQERQLEERLSKLESLR